RVTLFVAYLSLISLLPDLRRVFQYHAAEHKAINAYEAGEELKPNVVQRYSLIHPRCGTAFLLWVMVIAIFVFAFFGRPSWYWLIATRILLLPVIAGIAYELIRFAGKHTDNRVLMTLLAPGLWLQRLPARRASSLAAVLADVVAQRDRYAAPRALALFSMLQENTYYLARHWLPPAGTDVIADDGMLYRSFPGQGLQFHPLGNFARLG